VILPGLRPARILLALSLVLFLSLPFPGGGAAVPPKGERGEGGAWASAAFAASSGTLSPEPFRPSVPVFPLSELRPGMRGEARTVLKGNRVVSFPVRILDVVRGPGSPRNLILLRAEGPLIREIGGIASGMSGSPVFVRGKLVGAIGYGWDFADHNLGMAVPIGEMGRVFLRPGSLIPRDLREGGPPVSSDAGGREVLPDQPEPSSNVREEPDPEAPREPDSADQEISGDAAATPLLVSGLSARGAEELERALGQRVRAGLGGGSGMSGRRGGRPIPGSSVGVLLAWGDVEIGAIGTLTATDVSGRFVAFGHPLLKRGVVALPLTEARIHAVVPSLEAPFKLGSFGAPLGTVQRDRPEGIGGRLGVLPPFVEVRLGLTDVEGRTRGSRSFRVASDLFLLGKVLPPATLGVLDDLWGRTGPGTAKVTLQFFRGDRPFWSRTNTFFSEKDVMSDAVKEFGELTALFAQNQFRDLSPLSVRVDVEATATPRILYIEEIDVDEDRVYAPGDVVKVVLRIRPWREEPRTRTVTLRIPKDAEGPLELLVRGGGIEEPGQDAIEAGSRAIADFDTLLRELGAKEANQELIVELRGAPDKEEEGKGAEAPDRLAGELREERIREGSMRVFQTNWYVDGLLRKVLDVETKERKERVGAPKRTKGEKTPGEERDPSLREVRSRGSDLPGGVGRILRDLFRPSRP